MFNGRSYFIIIVVLTILLKTHTPYNNFISSLGKGKSSLSILLKPNMF